MYVESSDIGLSHHDIDNSRISDVLNGLFCRGDRIQVFDGAEQIDGTGFFIRGGDDYFLWRDSSNHLRFQYLGGAIGIRKIHFDCDESWDECPSPDYD